jgi:Glutaredoxin-like domain (DUF836)
VKTVTLISKDDCHLCEVAKEVLLRAQKKTSFNLREKKITPGEADFEVYHERIPVILIEGEFAFQHRVSEQELLEKLKS